MFTSLPLTSWLSKHTAATDGSGRLKTSPGVTCDHSYRIILSWDCGTSSLGWTAASAMSPCLDMLAFLWDLGQRSLQEVSETTTKLQRIVNGSTSSNSSHPLWWRNMALLLRKSHSLLTKTVAWFSEGRGRDYLTLPTPPGERLSSRGKPLPCSSGSGCPGRQTGQLHALKGDPNSEQSNITKSGFEEIECPGEWPCALAPEGLDVG